MGQNSQPSSGKSLYFPAIVISDTHIGKSASRVEQLLEFLTHIRCDTLYINGDWIETLNQYHIGEREKRVLDAINYKAQEEGTKIYITHGNHDPLPGRMTRAGQFVPPVPGGIQMGYEFKHVDPQGRSYIICHGDRFDFYVYRKLYSITDAIYNVLVKFNDEAKALSQKVEPEADLSNKFNIAGFAKKAVKRAVGVGFVDRATAYARKHGADGILCGHTHRPITRVKKGVSYINSGDWVQESQGTFLIPDGDKGWVLQRWDDYRKRLGLTELPSVKDPNPCSKYRNLTEQQLSWIQSYMYGKKTDAGHKPNI